MPQTKREAIIDAFLALVAAIPGIGRIAFYGDLDATQHAAVLRGDAGTPAAAVAECIVGDDSRSGGPEGSGPSDALGHESLEFDAILVVSLPGPAVGETVTAYQRAARLNAAIYATYTSPESANTLGGLALQTTYLGGGAAFADELGTAFVHHVRIAYRIPFGNPWETP